jgi:O-antigen/teichoic acid export membrane protein
MDHSNASLPTDQPTDRPSFPSHDSGIEPVPTAPPVEPELVATGAKGRRRSLGSVVLRLSLTTGVITALGIVTGPLQARALGASGRGELAAIAVVSLWLPVLASLGLEAFVARQAARQDELPEVFGTLGLTTFVVGLLIAPVGFPISSLLAQGRHAVHLFILLQFLILPITLLAQLAYYCLVGLERWTAIIMIRLIPILSTALAVIVLFLLGSMTVTAIALVGVVSSMCAILPVLPAIFKIGAFRLRLGLLREAIPFGAKAWIGTVVGLTNGRLDQLLMVTLVSSRQLGLYAIAVTAASPANQIAFSLASPLLSRVASGERHLVSRALRITLMFVLLVNLIGIFVTPVLLPLMFGSSFSAAVPMALILFVAALPLCSTTLLSQAMVADGKPSVPAIAESLTLVITVPGLLVLVPVLGGIGAALVSLIAYGANSAIQLRAARRRFDEPISAFIIPRRTDFTWARARLTAVLTAMLANIAANIRSLRHVA